MLLNKYKLQNFPNKKVKNNLKVFCREHTKTSTKDVL